MWWMIVTTCLLTAPPSAQVTTLAGAEARGEVVRITTDEVVLLVEGKQARWPAGELLAVKFTAPSSIATPGPAVWIELIDGSSLLAQAIEVSAGVAKAKLTGGEEVEIPARSLRWVRLQEHTSDLAKHSELPQQWQTILAAKATGDLIVVRKIAAVAEGAPALPKAAPPKATLDYLEGIVEEIGAEQVQFHYNEQVIPVDRAKVEGVVYFHAAGRELPDPLCRVVDRAGSTWFVKSLALQDDKLQLVSTSGVRGEIPLARVEKLDYSAGKIVYLSDLKWESLDWRDYFGQRRDASTALLFSPRNDESFAGEPLTFGKQTYAKGLAIHSRTQLDYRLPGKFSKFLALAAIDDHVRPAGDVVLRISLDGKLLGEQHVTGKDEKPIPLEYDLTGGSRLSILVDFGAGLDLSDRLHLLNARVTK
jgi:hypothetical protein